MMRQVSHKHIVLLHGVCVRDIESELPERLSGQQQELSGDRAATELSASSGEMGVAAAAS